MLRSRNVVKALIGVKWIIIGNYFAVVSATATQNQQSESWKTKEIGRFATQPKQLQFISDPKELTIFQTRQSEKTIPVLFVAN